MMVMETTRTINHGNGHTDTEQLFGDVWAVTQCDCKLDTQETTMTKYNSLGDIEVDLSKSGICGTCGRRLTDAACGHGAPEQIEYTRRMDADIDADFDARAVYGKNWEQAADDLAALVDVLNASEPLGSVDVQQAHDWQDEADPIARARAIALPNGQLRSYASYNNASAGKPLSADEVDMDVEADDHWYHDNPNY